MHNIISNGPTKKKKKKKKMSKHCFKNVLNVSLFFYLYNEMLFISFIIRKTFQKFKNFKPTFLNPQIQIFNSQSADFNQRI
jgi:ABC-type phosphate transport system permease subunit